MTDAINILMGRGQVLVKFIHPRNCTIQSLVVLTFTLTQCQSETCISIAVANRRWGYLKTPPAKAAHQENVGSREAMRVRTAF
jgi:hypothetical protein